jgi:hypothetical protein
LPMGRRCRCRTRPGRCSMCCHSSGTPRGPDRQRSSVRPLLAYVAREYKAGRSLREPAELTGRTQSVLCTCQDSESTQLVAGCGRLHPDRAPSPGNPHGRGLWEARTPVRTLTCGAPG